MHDGWLELEAQVVHDFGVSVARGQHQGRLPLFVDGGQIFLVIIFDEDLDDGEVAERGSEVEVRVRESFGGSIWVVNKFRVGFEDAFDEGFVVGVNGASEAEGRFDPARRELSVSSGERQTFSLFVH